MKDLKSTEDKIWDISNGSLEDVEYSHNACHLYIFVPCVPATPIRVLQDEVFSVLHYIGITLEISDFTLLHHNY